MNKPTHVTCGVTTACAVISTAGVSFPLFNATILMPVSFITIAVGSLIADVDLVTSTMGRKFPIFSKIFTHRGMTHTLVFPALILAAIIFTDVIVSGDGVNYWIRSCIQSMWFGLCLGWVVHIFADMFNSKGCPILWPISKSKISIANVRLQHWTEKAFLFLFITCHVIFVVIFHGWHIPLINKLL